MNTIVSQDSFQSVLKERSKKWYVKKLKSQDVESPQKQLAKKLTEADSSKLDEEYFETQSAPDERDWLFDEFSNFDEDKVRIKPSTPEPKKNNEKRRAKWPLRKLKVIYE